MWDRVIELSDYESVRLRDILSALQCALSRAELEEFSQQLLACLGKENPVPEPLDYEMGA